MGQPLEVTRMRTYLNDSIYVVIDGVGAATTLKYAGGSIRYTIIFRNERLFQVTRFYIVGFAFY
jgi:hypothetical protein